MFLHACKLTIRHPATGEPATFAAALPPDLNTFLAKLAVPDAQAV
jgi:hypothetical protein